MSNVRECASARRGKLEWECQGPINSVTVDKGL